MNLFDQINEDIKSAMKSREKEKLEALRGIKKVLLEAKTATGSTGELSDQEVLKIIQKLAKQGKDSANIYKEQGREDLYQQEITQVEVFESYLPSMLSDEELTKAIQQIIQQTGASGMKDMGKVMGIASKSLAGQADGKDIAEKVKKMLN
ncbi:MAG: glutamyl-tRNA amidotransferase [Bacteroidetes bacterium GWF2_42_66]|nr:MAG: glutamyl-tRNA amidotransferase [Bacteroidetes bacterium GWA2_42_15]OFY00178.1 MAG: glutamyl-tRNA amidotransferase [Bacteroidetes bacterium GWE2_42_39]OFY40319.1 MAG: glutamyl-tRNA amidotransferase [Bacteroidetes bacterium GWF2_42_66]HBL73695.1 glutamyl-tRNA amidotransferase [Prolixibacteraceae bacterium]HCR90705.1 glutamyl-tRNA amidotransferase [Prolixibacteraceae bacterium]